VSWSAGAACGVVVDWVGDEGVVGMIGGGGVVLRVDIEDVLV
jgi:hypothetical protein